MYQPITLRLRESRGIKCVLHKERCVKNFIILLQQHDEEIRDWSEPICGRQEPQGFIYYIYRGERNYQVCRVSVCSLGMSHPCIHTRRSRETVGGGGRSVLPTTHRRQMVRVGDNRVRLRRSSRVLLAHTPRRETDQEGDSTADTRVEETSRNPSRDSETQSGTRKDSDMLGPTGSQQSGSGEELCGMQSLSVRDRVNRFYLDFIILFNKYHITNLLILFIYNRFVFPTTLKSDA